MQLLGVQAGKSGQTNDRVFLHLLQPAGLPHAVALLHVMKNGDHLRLGQLSAIENGPFVLAEPLLADLAEEQADLLVLADALTDAEVPGTPIAKRQAAWIQTAKTAQIVRRPGLMLQVLHD